MAQLDISRPGLTLITAAPINHQQGLLAFSIDELFEDREPHSILAFKDGENYEGQLIPSNCCDICIVAEGLAPTGYMLCEDGSLWRFSSGQFEPIAEFENTDKIPPMRSISVSLDGTVYAVGGSSSLFTLSGKTWMATPLLTDDQKKQYPYIGFEKVLTTNNGNLLLTGWHGLTIEWNGEKSTILPTPTNLDLHDAFESKSGRYYFCGDHGTVLQTSNGSDWTTFANDITTSKLWSICEFSDRIFTTERNFLYEILDNHIEHFAASAGDHAPSYGYKFKRCNDTMWLAGEKQLHSFDGERWTMIFSLLK